jgi:hypothetical protein
VKAATRLRSTTTVAVAGCVIAIATALLAGCSSAIGGNGSPAAAIATSTRSSSAPLSTATTAATSAAAAGAASSSPAASPTPELVTNITGTGTVGGTYQMTLWAHDVISDCGAHSYGQQIIAYFSAHPCRSATRRLWTMPLDGRTLAVSVVSVSAQITKVNENPDFQYAQQLADLENADGTGSVNDLLREGSRIPGAGASIPGNEVFSVLTQDGLVVIMDVWYVTGATNPKDADLADIEADLTFSDAAAPDA